MRILYPSNPLRPKQPDEQFAAEIEAVQSAGFQVSLFSVEDFQAGTLHAIPALSNNSNILYRGWMLSSDEYQNFESAVKQAGSQLYTTLNTYLSSHYLPLWYSSIADLTPETRMYPVNCDLEAELRALNWPEFFIKDYVKSLKTSVGSRISKPSEIATVVAEMRRFRGRIEGGYCVRRVERFLPETERRYLVLNGVPYAQSGDVPSIVFDCARRHRSHFYSVDVIQREDGAFRIVEIGDGQVSDLVGWTPERFSTVLRAQFATAD